MAPFMKKNAVAVCASKGLADEAGHRLSEIISEKFSSVTDRIVVLSGPNHAEEVGLGLPAATVAASEVPEAVQIVQDVFMRPVFRVYRSDDIRGVEYGGALKNISIGIASAHGKAHIHGVGVPEELWTADHNSFLECMADAAKSVVDYLGRRNMAFINVANRLSVDCDCDAHPHEPEMADIGVFASLDPVALDQACVDAVYASPDPGKAALIERMESRNGIHTVETACALGIGVREYELIYLD